MSLTDIIHAEPIARTNWVRLRTLIYLRWLAVAGQAVAVIAATQFVGIALRLDLCLLLMGASVLFNVIAMTVAPENQRLSERAATLTLVFDLTQLGLLLYLTGGITNPFAPLVLAQTVIAATVLTLRAAMVLGGLSLLMVALLSVVYQPLMLADGSLLTVPPILVMGMTVAIALSIIFIGGYARLVSIETFSMAEALTATQLALEREQKLTALGGLVAAAAHELGSPLATVMLTSSELAEELADRPELQADALLIHAQAKRCREILTEMGSSGKEDLHLRHAPLAAVVEEAAKPHVNRGPDVLIRVGGYPLDTVNEVQPEVARRPEIIHGLRNLVQNAVDYAKTSVWVDLDWTDSSIVVRIGDDGPGYPLELLGRIGDPYLRPRAARDAPRPAYAGMGLGLFIAKTLLERTGGRLTFANAGGEQSKRSTDTTMTYPTGAIVEVRWIRSAIETPRATVRGPLGGNRPITVT